MSVVSLEEAVAEIPAGALLTFGGFQLNRAPMALVLEILRQERRGFRVITLPNPIPLDLMIGSGAVEEAEFGFCGFQYEEGFAVAPNLRRAVQEGTVRWRERDVYELIQGLRAAAMGLPFLPAPGGDGSDYRRANGTICLRSPEGEEVPIVGPLRPDVALIHAQVADRDGNLGISDPYAESLLARASRRVIATTERIVERVSAPTVPGACVTHLAEVSHGAAPTSCHRIYRYDRARIRDYLDQAAAGRDEESRGVIRSAIVAEVPGRVDPLPKVDVSPDASSAATRDAADRLVVELARRLDDGEVVATGVASALPMLAVALARATRAPRLTYINCVGAVNPRIERAFATSVDVDLLDVSEGTVSLPELFDLARRGRIDTMFFGAAQIDNEARINLTCIGDYSRPKVKLPGPAGSSSMRSYVPKVILMMPRHTARALVPRVDFITAAASPRNRETTLVSDLALLRLAGGRLRLVSRHAGVGVEQLKDRTGFALEGDWETITPEPTTEEMAVLRRLDPDGLRYRMIGGGRE